MHSRHNQSRVDCTQMYQTRPSVFEGFVLGLEGNEVGRFTQPVGRQMVFSMEAVRLKAAKSAVSQIYKLPGLSLVSLTGYKKRRNFWGSVVNFFFLVMNWVLAYDMQTRSTIILAL